MPKEITQANTASKTPKVSTIKNYEINRNRELFANAKDNIRRLKNITKNIKKSTPTFNKEKLANYLKNISSNEKNIRDLSWYLYYRSMTYRRVINYYANMFYLQARNIVPNYDLEKENNDEKILKSYYQTINVVNNINLKLEFLKIYITCFIQDVFYGVGYLDEECLYILPLPTDRCKIIGNFNSDGSLCFAFDMSYFKGVNEYLLEYWGEPFESLYREYGGNNANRWQIIPEQYSVCLKYSIEDWQTLVPPFSGAFMDIINLEDIKDTQAIADEQEIYKLLYYKLNLLSGSKMPDQFAITPDLAIEYINRFTEEAIPEYTSFGMIPGDMDLGVVDFSSNDKVNDTTKVTKATKEVLNTMGGSQVLNGATITGAEAMKIAQRVDTEFAISSLLPQTEIIVNRLLSFVVKDHAKIKFFPISVYTRDDFRDVMLNSCQNGFMANVIAYNTLNGVSEKDTLAMIHLTTNILKLQDKLIPLSTSYTASSKDTDPITGGRPTETGEATDEADASR